MKKFSIVLIAIVMLFFVGCFKDIFTPTEGLVRHEVGNVMFVFDLKTDTVTLHNYNASTAKVEVQKVNTVDAFTVCKTYVSGGGEIIKSCQVDSDDDLKVIITVNGEVYEDEFTIG